MKSTNGQRRYLPLLSLFLLLLPTLSFAAIQDDASQLFDLSLTDPSHIFLGQLFGTVGTVLHGTGNDVFGILFRYFNLGIISVCSLFMLWTTVKVIISSSNEGSFMGRGGQGAHHVLRSIAGIGMLVPTKAGYSVIQMVVMYFVVQGAGFANTVWDKLLTAFENGSQLMSPPSTDLASVTDLTGTILMAQVCMYYHEKMEHDLQLDARKLGSNAPNFERGNSFPGFHANFDSENKTLSFPAKRGNNLNDAGCGQFSWAQQKPQNNEYVETALRTIVSSTAYIAHNVANPHPSDITLVDKKNNITQLDRNIQITLVGANSDWSNILLPIRAKENGSKLEEKFYKKARKDGWLYAGGYYYDLSKVQHDLIAATEIKLKMIQPIACIATKGEYINFDYLAIDNTCTNHFSTQYANTLSAANLQQVYQFAAHATGHAKTLAKEVQEANSDVMIPKQEKDDLGMMSILLYPIHNAIFSLKTDMAQRGVDPIMKLQSMGNRLMGLITVVWLLGSIAIFALSATISVMSSTNSFGYALSNTMSMVIPLLMGLLAVLFVQGAILSVYVPLIPFIIYTFAVLGWFIAVIEAMIAAPLVALGVTHPEGQGLLGKSEQAMMLLLGVFLRPVLMIMGLFSGMLLSRIMLTILNVAFVKAILSAIGMWGFVAAFMIYVVLVVQVVTQCYSLIYLVPDRILRWLGVGSEQSMVSEPLRAAESTQQRIAEPGAQVGRGAVEGWKGSGDMISRSKAEGTWQSMRDRKSKKLTGSTI